MFYWSECFGVLGFIRHLPLLINVNLTVLEILLMVLVEILLYIRICGLFILCREQALQDQLRQAKDSVATMQKLHELAQSQLFEVRAQSGETMDQNFCMLLSILTFFFNQIEKKLLYCHLNL